MREMILAALRTGTSARELARRLGCHHSTVQAIGKRLTDG
jgi:IS30 family transposase